MAEALTADSRDEGPQDPMLMNEEERETAATNLLENLVSSLDDLEVYNLEVWSTRKAKNLTKNTLRKKLQGFGLDQDGIDQAVREFMLSRTDDDGQIKADISKRDKTRSLCRRLLGLPVEQLEFDLADDEAAEPH